MPREVEIGRGGAGGKALQVHVDSLPTNLREDWYLARGITLHKRADPVTGQAILTPEQSFERNAQHDKAVTIARWRLDVTRPALALPKQSGERRDKLDELSQVLRLHPNGKTKKATRRTLEYWVRDYEADSAGLNGLMPKVRKDKGAARTVVTQAWDRAFADHISAGDHGQIGDKLVHYIRSLWASGARGNRAVSEQATTKLIELSRALNVVSFEALELGRPVTNAGSATQFQVCCVNRRMAEDHRKYGVIATKNKDNAVFQDKYMPSIRRDYSDLAPRNIVVGDVHPIDIMCLRPDGTKVFPKGIAWFDPCTNELHMTFVFLEQGEGVRREHIAMSFIAMVAEWGLPKMLYLDNGSEYSWDEMITGFTQLSKLTNHVFGVNDLDGSAEVSARVSEAREAIVRSRPYNAKGKPGIEGAFSVLKGVFFANIQGWVAGDRMKMKTHMKGRDPVCFDGDEHKFMEVAGKALEWYNKRPQQGRLKGQSPNECLRGFIDNGWGKTVLSRPEVLALAFAEEVERMPDRGRVEYAHWRGEALYFYDDALLGYDRKITLRVPAFNPEYVFCFNGEELICQAFPERTYGVLERVGAQEVGRRSKVFRRKVSDMGKHIALLSLTDETTRHIAHLPDAPEAPVAATVDAGMLDNLARMDVEKRRMLSVDRDAKSQTKRSLHNGPPAQT